MLALQGVDQLGQEPEVMPCSVGYCILHENAFIVMGYSAARHWVVPCLA